MTRAPRACTARTLRLGALVIAIVEGVIVRATRRAARTDWRLTGTYATPRKEVWCAPGAG
jgi:hypothetical protein